MKGRIYINAGRAETEGRVFGTAKNSSMEIWFYSMMQHPALPSILLCGLFISVRTLEIFQL